MSMMCVIEGYEALMSSSIQAVLVAKEGRKQRLYEQESTVGYPESVRLLL